MLDGVLLHRTSFPIKATFLFWSMMFGVIVSAIAYYTAPDGTKAPVVLAAVATPQHDYVGTAARAWRLWCGGP